MDIAVSSLSGTDKDVGLERVNPTGSRMNPESLPTIQQPPIGKEGALDWMRSKCRGSESADGGYWLSNTLDTECGGTVTFTPGPSFDIFVEPNGRQAAMIQTNQGLLAHWERASSAPDRRRTRPRDDGAGQCAQATDPPTEWWSSPKHGR